MSIYEYNEEYVKKTIHEEGYDYGKNETLVKTVEAAMKNWNINLPKACEGLGVTVEEYQRAKEKLQDI